MRPWVGAPLALSVLAARLTAQTLPVPALPVDPEPTPGAEGGPSGSAEPGEASEAETGARRPRPWEYAFDAGIGWDSNIDFAVPDGPSGVAVLPRGSVSRVIRGRRAQLRASAGGRWTGYPDQKEHNRYYADFAVDGTYRPSAGTTWRAGASHESGYSDSSRILLEQGVLLPLLKTRSFAGALGLSQKMGPRTGLRLNGRFYRTGFDSDTPGFIDGESLRATIALERQISSRSTVAIEYAAEGVLSDQLGRSYLTHFGSLQWTRVLSPRSALLLEAGASYTPDAERAGLERPEAFFGGGSFSRQLGRSSVTAFVRREVTPAFGIGVSRLELRAGLRATVPLGRNWELRTLASGVQPDTPPSAEDAYPASVDAFAALGRRLGRHGEISAEARYRRQGATSALPMIEGMRAGLFLSLLTPSGRSVAAVPWR